MMLSARGLSRACVAVLVLGLSLSACSRVSIDAGYTPPTVMSQSEAVAVITRCLEEQPGGYAVLNVEVSPTKLMFERSSGRFLRGGSTRGTGFYFDSLGKMVITTKSNVSVVRVWDASGVFRFHVVISDPARAQQFVDAMASMAKP